MVADLELSADARVVRDFFATVLSGPRDTGSLDRFLAPGFVDHSAEGSDWGVSGVRAKLDALWAALPNGEYVLTQVVAEHGLVAARSQLVGGKQPVDFADFYRIEGGRIAEHWHVVDASRLEEALS